MQPIPIESSYLVIASDSRPKCYMVLGLHLVTVACFNLIAVLQTMAILYRASFFFFGLFLNRDLAVQFRTKSFFCIVEALAAISISSS